MISTNESFRRVALTRGRRPPSDVTVVRSGPRASLMQRQAPEPELRTPEIIEELDQPVGVAPTDPAAGATPEVQPEPELPVPPAADPRASEMTMIAPSRVRASLGEEASEAAVRLTN